MAGSSKKRCCDPLKRDVIHSHGENLCQPPKYYDLKNHDILCYEKYLEWKAENNSRKVMNRQQVKDRESKVRAHIKTMVGWEMDFDILFRNGPRIEF